MLVVGALCHTAELDDVNAKTRSRMRGMVRTSVRSLVDDEARWVYVRFRAASESEQASRARTWNCCGSPASCDQGTAAAVSSEPASQGIRYVLILI